MMSGPHCATPQRSASAIDGSLAGWRRRRLTLASLWFLVIVSAFVVIDIQRQVTIPIRDGQPNIRLWLRLR